MKQTILMIPSWYPTKENPFDGSFFREQAIAVQKYYDFVVLRYCEEGRFAFIYALRSLFNRNKPVLNFVQEDNGLKEYSLKVYTPRFIVWNKLTAKLRKKLKHETLREGTGRKEDPYIVKARQKSIKWLKKNGKLPDFDCVYSLTSQDMASIGSDFSTLYSVPHVTAEHAPFPWPGKVLSDRTVEAIEKADAFLAISNDKIRQVLLQNVHVNPIWVGNLCDETKFKVSRKKHAVPTFLIVAANSFYKNLPLFIKAMEELKKKAKKDFRIVIAGYNANKGYSQNAKQLEETVHSSIINENTQMIEAVNREDMPGLYNDCDVFVMTSIQEGLPVSALEASMSGLPVISTRCGGVEDYVDDSMGRIFSITDYKGIADACNDYLNGKITFNNKKIRDRAVSLFGKEAFVERMHEVFEGAMKK